MKLTFAIIPLAKPEHWGDWHDNPLKWIALTSNAGFSQKFSTKKDAEFWAHCVNSSENFAQAQTLFQAGPQLRLTKLEKLVARNFNTKIEDIAHENGLSYSTVDRACDRLLLKTAGMSRDQINALL